MPNRLSAERWGALMVELGCGEALGTFDKLVAAYAEPHRHYHTGEHISACFGHFDGVKYLFERPAEAEIALWFHDVIYDPHSNSNERDSADWAAEFLQEQGCSREVVERVASIIMATEHHATALSGDTAVLVDIDLSILGSAPATYQQFEQNVRKEYAFVPVDDFRTGRTQILQSFLARDSVYQHEYFQARYESAARANIHNAIERLTSQG